MNSDRIERVKGDIFDHSLQDSIGLDGLILQVRHGFNPVDVAWRKYMEHPNMRIDANTVYMHIMTECITYLRAKSLPRL